MRKRKFIASKTKQSKRFKPKEQDYIVFSCQAIGTGLIFIYDLWKEIGKETGLHLEACTVKSKRQFLVCDADGKDLKKGDLYVCLRYIIDEWRKP